MVFSSIKYFIRRSHWGGSIPNGQIRCPCLVNKFFKQTFLPSKTSKQSLQNPFYIMGFSHTQKGHPFWPIMSPCPFGSAPLHAEWTHPNNKLLSISTCHPIHSYLDKHHLFCLCCSPLQHVVSIHLQLFATSPPLMFFFGAVYWHVSLIKEGDST